MRLLLLGACLALCLGSALAAAPADPVQLTVQGKQAYEEKRFAESAELYVAAMAVGANKIDCAYNAACAYALAGKLDQAFEHLQLALEAGLRQNPAQDPDFASLHADPRWKLVQQRFDDSHPELKYLPALRDEKLSIEARYFVGRKAVAEGVPLHDNHSLFNQYYGTLAQYVGEYDEANRVYGHRRPMQDPLAAGYDRAVDAVPVVLAKARGRQAVFLNESHGQAQTRAANFALLAGLRAEGFDVLAIEALASNLPVARDATRCSDASLADDGLAARGYAVAETGYYTRDPVFAHLIREAIRLGFRLVAYDSYHAEHDQAQREQNQADNLACLFKSDPGTRLVVLAGLAHIYEGKDFWVPGGVMASRFRAATGIDPLTVDTAMHTFLDPKTLGLDASPGTRLAPSYVLQNAAGESFGGEQVDFALFVPGPAHRNDGQPSWLELGGARKRVAVARSECQGQDPCLVEAQRVGEDAKAVPGDRCVVGGLEAGCTLFLAPGKYEIATYDSAGAQLASRNAKVRGK